MLGRRNFPRRIQPVLGASILESRPEPPQSLFEKLRAEFLISYYILGHNRAIARTPIECLLWDRNTTSSWIPGNGSRTRPSPPLERETLSPFPTAPASRPVTGILANNSHVLFGFAANFIWSSVNASPKYRPFLFFFEAAAQHG